MRVLISCGGTGGHIFPGLSLYNALRKTQGVTDILLALDEREISAFIAGKGYPHTCICFSPFRLNFNLQSLVVVLKLLKGIVQSLRVILSYRPDVVVGFGGYASFFVVFFARMFRIKTIIHEQNATPGKANRILAYFTNKIAVSFPDSERHFGANAFKVKFTGMPLRQDLVRIDKSSAYEFLGLSADKFTVLVTGGSQGSRKINSVFLKAANLIEGKDRFQVIHVCGKQDQQFLNRGYEESGIKAKVFSFLERMEYAYSAADIVISRAGAVTINEIILFGLASVLIPYPYARQHQMENVQYLTRHNAAVLIEEKNLSPEILKQEVLKLFNTFDLRQAISRNVSMLLYPGADMCLRDMVLHV
ncbi:undecaprenyldiphospho-muramoylpentapeptide beta-N-acetylglucosaminyltransferase [Candidatus Omnitrophota bacterium]